MPAADGPKNVDEHRKQATAATNDTARPVIV